MATNLQKFEGQGHFEYPFRNPSNDIWNRSLGLKIVHGLERLRIFRQIPKRDPKIELHPVRPQDPAPLGPNDLPLLCPVHNDMRMLRSFLKHYRSIGVTRFIFIDDRSSDGSLEFLLEQPDTDIFHSNVRFVDANRGRAWREMLAARYGKNRWYVNVDSDEYLFTGANTAVGLREYTAALKRNGIDRLPAPMIDMIPYGSVRDAIFSGEDDSMPWETISHLDAFGYKGFNFKNGVNLRGGARVRLYDAKVELMKYPLIFWDEKTSLGSSIHQPKPGYKNFGNACGCLLHFTIFSDVKQVVADAKRDGQYFMGGIEYERMGRYFEENDGGYLTADTSVRFSSEQQLVELGFIKTVGPY